MWETKYRGVVRQRKKDSCCRPFRPPINSLLVTTSQARARPPCKFQSAALPYPVLQAVIPDAVLRGKEEGYHGTTTGSGEGTADARLMGATRREIRRCGRAVEGAEAALAAQVKQASCGSGAARRRERVAL